MVFGYYEPVAKPDLRSTFNPLYPVTTDGDIHLITANQGQFELIKFYYSEWDRTELIRFGSMRDIWNVMENHPNSTFFLWIPPVDAPDELTEAKAIESFVKTNGEKVTEIHRGTVHYAIYKVPSLREPFVSPPPLKSDFQGIIGRTQNG
jgi:hypothetical protein